MPMTGNIAASASRPREGDLTAVLLMSSVWTERALPVYARELFPGRLGHLARAPG